MKIAVCLVVMSSVAVAAPGDQCKAPTSSASDELSGTTYTWVKDDGGMAPSKGNVLRLDFYGGHADITATTGSGAPTVWTGSYSLAGGKITIHMDGEGIAVDAKDQPYTKTGDDLVLPFGLVKGAKSTWHRTKQQIVTRVVKSACVGSPMKPQCKPPGGMGTSAFGKDCLFFDTTLDGKLLDHEQLCVVDCDFNADPENYKCPACVAGLEGKVAFSSFDGLPDATRTKLSKLYGDLVSAAQPDSYARCVAEAKLADADAAQTAMYRSGQKTTQAQEDAASKAVSDARKALQALVDHPEKRKPLEQQILDILLADMIPFQKVCKFDAAPTVKFKIMGAYSAPATPDTSCDPDDADLTSPTQLSRIAGGFEQQIFDSLFYSRDKKTGFIHADRYESAAAALVHEGFHHDQYNCGEGWAASDAARSMILELTEVMTYALSENVPFYKFMLSSQEREVWTAGGRRANMRAFQRTWAGKRWCAKQNKEIPVDGAPPTDADRKWVASYAFAAYPWMQSRMELDVADDDGLWIKLCNKTSPIKGVQCGNATRLKDVEDHKAENRCR